MKSQVQTAILIGGILNLLLSLFHVFLCYQIYQIYHAAPVYPLMQMFAIAGSFTIFFLAYTSLFSSHELSSNIGAAVIILNILIYLSRALGEILLFPQPKPVIIILCLVLALLYGYILINRRNIALIKK